MPIKKTPPPGHTTKPWLILEMSRQNFYQSGLNTLWSDGPLAAYQTEPNTPILYSDVGMVKYWLFVRQGLIALNELPSNAPLLPSFEITSWFNEDPNGRDCPRCEGAGVAVDEFSDMVWCPKCSGEIDSTSR